MIEAPNRPAEVRVEKPDQLNLANMVYQARFLKEMDLLDSQPQNWEVYVKSKYDDELEHIQKFTPDGKVSILTRNRGEVQYHEYDYDYALSVLNEGVISVQEPQQYRTYITDFSLVHNPELDASGEADSLRKEFTAMHEEVEVIDWKKEASERAEEDRVRAETAAVRLKMIADEAKAREEAEEQELSAARIPFREMLEGEGFVMGAPEIEETDDDKVLRANPETPIPLGPGEEVPVEPKEPITPIPLPPARPLEDSPIIEWPHIDPVPEAKSENGTGNSHVAGFEVPPAPKAEAQVPEGCKVIELKNGQKRLKRIADGKFVGKDGLTKKERGEVLEVKPKTAPVESNGHKNGNGNGHGKTGLEGTTVVARRSPERTSKGTRAPRGEAPTEDKSGIEEHEIVNFREIVLQPDEFNIVYLDGSQLRELAESQRANLDRMVKNLRVDGDIPTLEELIKNMFRIDVKLVPPQKVPVHN